MDAEETTRKAKRVISLFMEAFSRCTTRKKAAWMSMLMLSTNNDDITGSTSVTQIRRTLNKLRIVKLFGKMSSILAAIE